MKGGMGFRPDTFLMTMPLMLIMSYIEPKRLQRGSGGLSTEKHFIIEFSTTPGNTPLRISFESCSLFACLLKLIYTGYQFSSLVYNWPCEKKRNLITM